MNPTITKIPSLHVLSAFSLLLISFSSPTVNVVNAAVSCNATHNPCEELLHKGSQCIKNQCTNPFEGGCLKSLLQEDEYSDRYASDSVEGSLRRRVLSVQRVCNSEDPKSSPFCKPNSADGYSEVRIFEQNWESAIATSWMLQIILSEILNVPATIETGVADQNANFYNRENRMDYGNSANDDKYESFQHAFDAEGGDCTVYQGGDNGDEDGKVVGKENEYISCAHFLPELWDSGQMLVDKKKKDVTELPGFTGGAGVEGWYITKSSIQRDPSLDYYTGYQDITEDTNTFNTFDIGHDGDDDVQRNKNRQKLAKRFKRPTTWRDYCTLVSTNNCSIPDEIVDRAPAEDGSENGRYFVEGSYTGHFRATDKNNCTKTKNCTGHFMDFPCGWSSYFRQQAYHLDIALESNGNDVSGGYAYSEMVEIWKAANATSSDLIGQWWTPDATFTSFIGTDSELSKVTLPAPTQECYKARASNQRCDADATFFDKYGAKEGACDEKSIGLKKVVVGNMESNIEENKNLKAAMSPSYDLLDVFQLAELQLDDILHAWSARRIDPYNFDLRFVSCKWMADNLEYITRLIPQSHPRVFVETSFQTSPMTIFVTVTSWFAIAVTVATAFLISGLSQCQPISALRLYVRKNSQIEFVYLLVTGLLFLAVGAHLLACKPSKGMCISSVWFINVGYTLVLVPTLVRVSAIIKVLQAGRKFRRVTVDKNQLLKTSIGISAIAAVFCAIWTGVDPLMVQEELSMVDETNILGETVVWVSYYCESESGGWFLFSFVWQCLLLISGSVLAYQIRSAPPIVNDSKELAFMIYSSSISLILRIVVYVLGYTLPLVTRGSLQKVRSLLWSIDSVVHICIYFSKFLRNDVSGGHTTSMISPPHVVGENEQQTAPMHRVRNEVSAHTSYSGQCSSDKNSGLARVTLHPNPSVECDEEKAEETEMEMIQPLSNHCGSVNHNSSLKSEE